MIIGVVIGIICMIILILVIFLVIYKNKYHGGDNGHTVGEYVYDVHVYEDDSYDYDSLLIQTFISHSFSVARYMFWFNRDIYDRYKTTTWAEYFMNYANLPLCFEEEEEEPIIDIVLDTSELSEEDQEQLGSVIYQELLGRFGEDEDHSTPLMWYINNNYSVLYEFILSKFEEFLNNPFIDTMRQAFEYECLTYDWTSDDESDICNIRLDKNNTPINSCEICDYIEDCEKYRTEEYEKIVDITEEPTNFLLRNEDITRAIYGFILSCMEYNMKQYTKECSNIGNNDDFKIIDTVIHIEPIPEKTEQQQQLDAYKCDTYYVNYDDPENKYEIIKWGNDDDENIYYDSGNRFMNFHRVKDIYHFNNVNNKRCLISYSQTKSEINNFKKLFDYFINCYTVFLIQYYKQIDCDYDKYIHASFIYSVCNNEIDTNCFNEDQRNLLLCIFNHDFITNEKYPLSDSRYYIYEPHIAPDSIEYENGETEQVISVSFIPISDADTTMWYEELYIDSETDERGTQGHRCSWKNAKTFYFKKTDNPTVLEIDWRHVNNNYHFMKSIISLLTKMSLYVISEPLKFILDYY